MTSSVEPPTLGDAAPRGHHSGYRGRFAPSPTGSLHLGNARSALLAWVRARLAGGEFIVRVEDLDAPRTRAEAVTGNLDELRWLGLTWDEGPDVGGPNGPYLQSQRSHLYKAALDRLEEDGMVFDCYLSRKDVAGASSAPHPPRPDGTAPTAARTATTSSDRSVYGAEQRRLNAEVTQSRIVAGRSPSVRLLSGGVEAPTTVPTSHQVEFLDAIAGPQVFDVERDVGDFVLLRSDGLWAYQLAVVVDDAAMGITEVVRAADLLESTAAQLLLYRALGLAAPGFAHVGLLLDEDGQRLSKRSGPLSLGDLARSGVDPRRVVGLLAYTLGWLDTPRPVVAPDLLVAVTPERLQTAPSAAVRLSGAELGFLTSAS